MVNDIYLDRWYRKKYNEEIKKIDSEIDYFLAERADLQQYKIDGKPIKFCGETTKCLCNRAAARAIFRDDLVTTA